MAHFSGLIDEIRISKIARYTTDFTPAKPASSPTADTLALYHFDEGAGDVLTDSSGNNHHGKIVNAKWVPGIAAGPAVAPCACQGLTRSNSMAAAASWKSHH